MMEEKDINDEFQQLMEKCSIKQLLVYIAANISGMQVAKSSGMAIINLTLLKDIIESVKEK